MPELTVILDALTGVVLVEAPDRLPPELRDELTVRFGSGVEMGCARPLAVLPPPAVLEPDLVATPCVRVAGYTHNSLVEGPGRRTSLLVSGCTLGCRGCWVPHLHAPDAGTLVPVDRLAEVLLDPAYERDGVSILGGEPFQQPDGLLALVRALRVKECPHVLCYSGYTYEALRRQAELKPTVGTILDEIDVLIDGPYVQTLAGRAGPWTGSGNQRVIDLRETRRRRKIVLWRPTA